MKLTKQKIRKAVNAKIYNRGLSIYENQYFNVDKSGNTYTGQIEGTNWYDVEIVIEEDGSFDGECTCPYDWDWACKHMVAVALIAAEMQDEEDTIIVEEIEEAEIIKSVKKTPIVRIDNFEAQNREFLEPNRANFYERIFLNASTSIQAAFLKDLFEDNPELQSDFIRFQLKSITKQFRR